ncbi:DUF2884 family protein [Lysobacter sp. CA199]|uniref:DUF2884 family protein n=1 Tax=Lysobacter sp. CA199 TaxID=3455608 RepID=UPI003F8D00F4
MKAFSPLASLAVAAALLLASTAGCAKSSDSGLRVLVIDHLRIDGDRVLVRGDGGGEAEFRADGALSIDGRTIALTPAQQAFSRRYYQEASAIGREGAQMGKAGTAIAGHAVSSALEGIRTGNTDDIGKKVEAETSKLQARAKQMCGHVVNLRAAQDQLRASLPAFAPFSRIQADPGADCAS